MMRGGSFHPEHLLNGAPAFRVDRISGLRVQVAAAFESPPSASRDLDEDAASLTALPNEFPQPAVFPS